MTPTLYVVKTASAKMPLSVLAPYRRVAVLEVDPSVTTRPRMISARAKGVVRIVETWERLSAPPGSTRSAFARALSEAEALAADLNAKNGRTG